MFKGKSILLFRNTSWNQYYYNNVSLLYNGSGEILFNQSLKKGNDDNKMKTMTFKKILNFWWELKNEFVKVVDNMLVRNSSK